MTTIRELIDHLTDLVECEGVPEDARVLVAIQPSYPLAVTLDSVAVLPGGDTDWDEESDTEPDEDDRPQTVWLATGEHPSGMPYAPSAAFDGCRIGW